MPHGDNELKQTRVRTSQQLLDSGKAVRKSGEADLSEHAQVGVHGKWDQAQETGSRRIMKRKKGVRVPKKSFVLPSQK